MKEFVFFLNEEKEGAECHVFKGQFLGLNMHIHEKFSLCNKVDKEMCEEPVIRNQEQETMQMLCERSKRSICSQCLSILKYQYYRV